MSPRLELPKARAYRDFRIGDLFVASNGDTDIQATHINGQGIPVVSSGTKNNGIIGLTDIKAKVFEPRTITIDMFGNCYYQNDRYKMVTHARVFSLSPLDFTLNEKRGLYLVAQFSFLNKLFSYGNMASWQRIKDFHVSLPIWENGEIDFLFIENYMQAIKDYRIKELDDYLDSAGFEDCTLTIDEERALGANVPYKPFDIVKEFNVANSHNILKSDVMFGSGSIPYVTACEGNNSIVSHISFNDEMKEEGNSIMIGGKTLVITYQPDDFFSNDSHNLVLKINDVNGRTEAAQLFMVATLYKSLSPKYSWGDSISKAKIQKDKVSFPIDSNGRIDYTFMETYVRAIMKQTIGKLKVAMAIDSDGVAVEGDAPIILDSVPTSDRFTRFLPLYDVAIACGALVDEGVQSLGNNDVDMEGWIDVSDYPFKPNGQMFIVHAKGESMLPKIHPGDLCVFELYGGMGNAGSRDGKIVLARQHGKDNDYNCQYTIKEYHSVKDPQTGRNVKVELRPLNQDPQYKVIDVEEEDAEVSVIATLKSVLN